MVSGHNPWWAEWDPVSWVRTMLINSIQNLCSWEFLKDLIRVFLTMHSCFSNCSSLFDAVTHDSLQGITEMTSFANQHIRTLQLLFSEMEIQECNRQQEPHCSLTFSCPYSNIQTINCTVMFYNYARQI